MNRWIGWTILGWSLWMSTAAFAAIRIEPNPVAADQPATVIVENDQGPVEGATVALTYYPNTEVETHEKLTTDAQGRTSWIPKLPGLVALKATVAQPEGEDKEVGKITLAVRYPSAPVAGIAVFCIAACALFGGIVFGTLQLTREDRPTS